MNILRNSRSGQSTYCVGKAYGIAAGGCCSDIAFVVNNQALTSVGTPCAFVVGASWHGAREEEIKEVKKMKMKNITKWLAVSAVFGLLSLATQRADAVLEMSYTTDSANLLGTVIPADNSGGQAARDAAMTNVLLAQATQTQQTLNGSLYSRTTLAGGGPATIVGAVALTGYSGGTGNVTIDLSNNGYGAFTYLVASYDGPNGGVAVFNISGITTSVTVYGFAQPEVVNGQLTGNLLGTNVATQGYYRLTTITLLNPTGTFVPDGGATVMLLGAALGALGIVRRYLFS